MQKLLNSNTFFDDYNINNMNCIDLTFATYLGRFRKELYYFYSFLYACGCNWEINMFEYEDGKMMTLREKILNELGFDLVQIKVSSEEEFLDTLKNCVDHDEGVFFKAYYNQLFYYKNYRVETDKAFTFLQLNGYDEERGLAYVMDMIIARRTLSSYFAGEVFCPIQLTNEMVLEIWNRSRDMDRQETGSETNLYMIRKRKEEPSINTWKDVIGILKKNLAEGQDMLASVIDFFQYLLEKQEYDEKFFFGLYKFYKAPIVCITDGLKKGLFTGQDKQYEQFVGVITEYMVQRGNTINFLNIQAKHRGKLSANRRISMVEFIKEWDRKLLHAIEEQESVLAVYEKKNKKTNYMLGAFVTADSEVLPVSVLSSNQSEADKTCWLSMSKMRYHWVKVDLGRIINISEIQIGHYGPENQNTREFTILASHDKEKWDKLEYIKDNKQKETMHHANGQGYRYLWIDIQNPCLADNHARIRYIKVYGEPLD